MNVMLVGADNLGSIEKNLQSIGVDNVLHISGRNVMERRKAKIPSTVRCIVVFTDFVNHTTAGHVKKMAKAQNLPVVFTKRSWCALQEKITELRLQA